MTVNLHFLIKLAGIFMRGPGYANRNVVYRRLTEFWNKFSSSTFVGKKCEPLYLTPFMPVVPVGLWGGSQGRTLRSNEVISIAMSTKAKHLSSFLFIYLYRVKMASVYVVVYIFLAILITRISFLITAFFIYNMYILHIYILHHHYDFKTYI